MSEYMHMIVAKTTTTLTAMRGVIARPPIVAVLGHVDHGKTTLLDRIRSTDVAAKESGGITQHIGAYEVLVPQGVAGQTAKLTFLDTPGHEAFSRMRERGAKVADVAVLVVAADDGVKPQTKEALEAIRASGIPFVVALNKMDKAEASPERVKKELAEANVLIEEWGGTVPLVPTTARTGEGVAQLLDMIFLVAEMEELKGDPAKPASGVVIESFCDSRRGNTATLLVRDGTLRQNVCVVAGDAVARLHILENDRGEAITEAQFSAPVRVVGFDRLAPVGVAFTVADSKADACAKAGEFTAMRAPAPIWNKRADADVPVSLILKADVTGSLEALEDIAREFSQSGVAVQVLRAGVGNISEDDARLAAGKENVFVVGFGVKFEPRAEEQFARTGVAAHCFDVIYEAREWLRERIGALLPAEETETVLGKAKVQKVFRQKNGEVVLGGRVASGRLREGMLARFVRGSEGAQNACEGTVVELQHNKIRVAEINEGEEFGMRVTASCQIAEGDQMLVIERSVRRRTLE